MKQHKNEVRINDDDDNNEDDGDENRVENNEEEDRIRVFKTAHDENAWCEQKQTLCIQQKQTLCIHVHKKKEEVKIKDL